MLLPFLVALAINAPPQDEAEQLFHQMESKLSKAKTIEWNIEGSIEFPLLPRPSHYKASVLLAVGNKCRMEWISKGKMIGTDKEITNSLTEITDGKKTWLTGEGATPTTSDAPPSWNNGAYRATLARYAMPAPNPAVHTGGKKLTEYKVDEQLRVYDFKLGKKEKIGDREAQVVQYTLKPAGRNDPPMNVDLWLDTKTDLPLKRVLTAKLAAGNLTITETYTVKLDEKIDPKKFELPKD